MTGMTVCVVIAIVGMIAAAVAADRARYWRIRYEGLRLAVDRRHPAIIGRLKSEQG